MNLSKTILHYMLDPGLLIVLGIAGACFLVRAGAFLWWMFRRRAKSEGLPATARVKRSLALTASAATPFHSAIRKAPVFGALRYTFHAGLFIVPIWESGHIILLKSRLGISYTALPAWITDALTIFVIATGLYFGLKRFVDKELRQDTGPTDVALILLAIVPFITGFLYAHGTLASSPFLQELVLQCHILSGSLMLLSAMFLFVRTRLTPKNCVGCAACVENCPTGTLESIQRGENRTFLYTHYQCICCGACQAACPESAARLRHELSLRHFFALSGKQIIGEQHLSECRGCGALYVPDLQIANIRTKLMSAGMEAPRTLDFCNRCKKTGTHYPAPGF
ncbi:MAG: 4Fe-4S dicluster domain-containing protein [Desulfobacterales bacterium]|nr:4Fe-4S dicluster domain-containing protein [Desulfobacterales bacterium]